MYFLFTLNKHQGNILEIFGKQGLVILMSHIFGDVILNT